MSDIEEITAELADKNFTPENEFKVSPLDDPLFPKDIGPYQVIRPITPSHLNCIYEVIDTRTGQERVLKTSTDYPYKSLLDNEIRIIQRLNSRGIEGIVQSEEPFEHKGMLYLPLERLDADLEEYFDNGNYFVQLGKFMGFMADVLKSLEEEGVVHRDIKPSNIMVDSQGNLKLFDFGISFDYLERKIPEEEIDLKLVYRRDPEYRRLFRRDTEPGMIKGTLSFIAPEMLKTKSFPLPSSDRYSLGRTILKTLLDQYCPRDIRSQFRLPTTAAIVQKTYPRKEKGQNKRLIEEIKRQVVLPAGLEDIVRSLLLVDPNDRPTIEKLKALVSVYLKNVKV